MYAFTHCLPPVKLPLRHRGATLALRQLRGPDSGPRVRTRTFGVSGALFVTLGGALFADALSVPFAVTALIFDGSVTLFVGGIAGIDYTSHVLVLQTLASMESSNC